MKKFKLLEPIGIHKVGEVLEVNDLGYTPSEYDGKGNVTLGLRPVDILLLTKAGILEEIGDEFRWKPKEGEAYFRVNDEGLVTEDIWHDNYEWRNRVFNFSNCFSSNSLAREASREIKATLLECKKI